MASSGSSLSINGFVQLVHLMGNSEARATVLLGRKTGEDSSVYGPDEIRGGYRVLLRHVGTIFWRYVVY